MRSGASASLAIAVAFSSACTFDKKLLCGRVPVAVPVATEEEIEVRFVGVGGFFIRRGSQAILTAPLFSNPSWLSVGLGKVETRPGKVQDWLGKVELTRQELGQVRTILSGHAHYDHLLDVPSLYPLAASDATIFANLSAKNILAGYANAPSETRVPIDRVVALDAHAVGYEQDPAGQWQSLIDDADPEGGVRVLALKSEHTAQFELLGERLNFWEGQRNSPASSPPRKTDQWPQGQVLAYLIDFMDPQKRVVFRIHYADSPSCAPCGLVPYQLEDKRPVDLLILNAGGARSMAGYPAELIRNTCAKHVLLGHWEDFFKEFTTPAELEALPGVVEGLQRARAFFPDACLPAPGRRFSYPLDASAGGTCEWSAPANMKKRACGCRVGPDGKCLPASD